MRPAARRRQRLVAALPRQLRSTPLRPGVRQLHADLRRRVRVHEVDDAPPRRSTCSGAYMPVQPGVMRASPADVGHLGDHQRRRRRSRGCRGAPGASRRGMPSSAEYWHIGETTTRFGSTRPRSRNGVNIGGGGGSADDGDAAPAAPPRRANQPSTRATSAGSRTFRFSCVMRRRARQQAEGELQRLELAVVALGVLEPLEAHLRRALQRSRPPGRCAAS